MNLKTSHPKRVKRFKTKVSKANIALEAQYPKKLSGNLDADELIREIYFTKRTDEIINNEENFEEPPLFEFF